MGRSLLKRELVIYDKLSKILDAYKVDTTDKDVEESVKEILNHIDI